MLISMQICISRLLEFFFPTLFLNMENFVESKYNFNRNTFEYFFSGAMDSRPTRHCVQRLQPVGH